MSSAADAATASLDQNSLVLCSGTLMKASLVEMIDAAVAGGFDALTLFPQDVARAHADGLSDADIKARIADAGLLVADLDPLLTWLPGDVPEALVGMSNGDFHIAVEHEFFDIAAAIGGRSINIAQGFKSSIDRDAAAEAIAGLCDRAAEYGLMITLEFLPWSGVPDVSAALDIVERAGRESATIMLDTWHWFRGARDLAALRAVPGARIGSVQLNDAAGPAWDDLSKESTEARLIPGEGEIPIVEIVQALDAIGATAPIGVEVFSSELAKRPPVEVGKRCGEAARAILARARG